MVLYNAVLGGKLAAEVVSERVADSVGRGSGSIAMKEVQASVLAKAKGAVPRDPSGVLGEGAIAFGAGSILTGGARKQLEETDPQQLVAV